MPASAPRYPDALVRAVARLDDESLPIAEVCRRVAARADELGLTRPSYVHLRRLVQSERARRRELRRIRDDALAQLAAGLVPDWVEIALDVRDANAGRRRT